MCNIKKILFKILDTLFHHPDIRLMQLAVFVPYFVTFNPANKSIDLIFQRFNSRWKVYVTLLTWTTVKRVFKTIMTSGYPYSIILRNLYCNIVVYSYYIRIETNISLIELKCLIIHNINFQ